MLNQYMDSNDDEVAFMDTCLAGLMAALNDSRCSPLLEARLFAFGPAGKPFPAYQLRTKVLDRSASPFQIIQASVGSGKTIMLPVFLSQL